MAFDLSTYTTRTEADFNHPSRIYGFRFFKWLSQVYMHVIAKTKVYGLENIPKDHTHFIVASNHASNYDPFLVGSSIPYTNTSFLAKKELLEDPRTRLIMDLCGVIALNREKIGISSIRSCKAALKSKNWCLGIFPEGTRNKGGEVIEVKNGVGFFAKSTKAPVLPAAIHLFGKNNRKITIVFGPLIPYESQSVDEFTQLVMERIKTLKKEAEHYAETDF